MVSAANLYSIAYPLKADPPVVAGGFHETVIDVNDVGTTEVMAGVPGAWVGDPDVYA